MKGDIRNFIHKCKECNENKTNRHPIRAPMQITSTASKPFEKIFLDIVGPLPLTVTGDRYILTLQDDLSKFSYAYAIHNQEAGTIADKFCNFVFKFGIPSCIVTDNGTNFTSQLLKEVNKLFKVKHVTATPYHPQSNGALERCHSTLKDYLKHFVNKQQNNWNKFLETAMFAYNTRIHSTTHFSPYELIFGHKATLPNAIKENPKFSYSYDDYHKYLKLKLNISFEHARENIINSKQQSKKQYDKKVNDHKFQIGDFVYLRDNRTTPGLTKKLSPNFKGPFEIVEVHDNENVSIKIRNKNVRYHKNLIRPIVTDEDPN